MKFLTILLLCGVVASCLALPQSGFGGGFYGDVAGYDENRDGVHDAYDQNRDGKFDGYYGGFYGYPGYGYGGFPFLHNRFAYVGH